MTKTGTFSTLKTVSVAVKLFRIFFCSGDIVTYSHDHSPTWRTSVPAKWVSLAVWSTNCCYRIGLTWFCPPLFLTFSHITHFLLVLYFLHCFISHFVVSTFLNLSSFIIQMGRRHWNNKSNLIFPSSFLWHFSPSFLSLIVSWPFSFLCPSFISSSSHRHTVPWKDLLLLLPVNVLTGWYSYIQT